MGQQNILYAGPMLDMEPHHHPEPCMVSYGGVTCFPQPYNSHTILPPPGNRTTIDPRYLPENHGLLPYMITQYNGEHCNTFMIPSPSASFFSVPVNHEHLPFSNNHQIFERNRSLFMDGSNRVFKRSGSSVAVPMTSEGNRATVAMGFEFGPVVVHNSSHLVHGGHVVQALPAPWLDQHSGTGGFSWNRAHGVPYLQGTCEFYFLYIALHGYQVASMSRISPAFMHPPPLRPHQGPHNVYHPPLLPPPPPMSPLQPQNMDIHLQLPSSSHRHSTNTSTTYPSQNDADPGPRFVSPTMPHGVMVYEARRQPLMIDLIARHYSFPQLGVLPIDVLPPLSLQLYPPPPPPLCIYINLCEQGEQFGKKDSGLSDDCISDHVKTRIFASSGSLPADEEPNLCVICQMDFEDQEEIRMLDCRHEYHVECIKKWLIVKNNCPICKSTALN
ncbi:hypothetical protein SSX86_005805 [Deinandra increscens subsp. villosa]|uniref:RING-type E3 ubiquitin transferase n=1 Tax=Deinandra increscens subsp. villosa TaxID=3103831 RepID=A0AAP0DUM8_9ASTR